MKKFWSIALCACLASVVFWSGCQRQPDPSTVSSSGNPAGPSADQIVVSYNTPKEWANWGTVLQRFTAKTNIQAPSDPKNSGQTLAALTAEAAAPQADVAYYGIVFGLEAAEKNLVTGYEPPGFEQVSDSLKDPQGRWVGVHQGAIAFLVNRTAIGNTPAPKCWKDLTSEQYAGKVGFLDPTQAAVGYSVATAANLALGGSLTDWSPGMQYFKTLKQNGLILPAQTATALVQQGEIPILVDADFNGYKLKNDDSAPIDVVIPCESSIAVPYVMSLVKDAPRPENGKALIDFALSDEGQTLFAQSYLRPVRPVTIPPEVNQKMLPAAEYDRVKSLDFAQMRQVKNDFTERWKAEVGQ